MVEPLLHDGNPYVAQEAVFLKARCFLYKKQWDEMNKTMKELIRRNPAFANDLAVNLMRAVAAIEQEHPDEALIYLKKYLDQPSD
jgi:predicted negative regulator of RcsB-dependent stress response